MVKFHVARPLVVSGFITVSSFKQALLCTLGFRET
jgi:hypothetical protein